MECQVLKHFSFQIYTPTSKTFLRRFLRAAQSSHLVFYILVMFWISIKHFSRKIETVFYFILGIMCWNAKMMASVEMEFLPNYLTELTLIEHQFLKFLPSVIAASAVFLAKWTVNQSSHPWVSSSLKHTHHVFVAYVVFHESWNSQKSFFFLISFCVYRIQHWSITQRTKPRIWKHVLRPCKSCSLTPKDVP